MATAPYPAGLTDTDILIDVEHGIRDAVNFINDQQTAGGLRISIMSEMELVVGCQNQKKLAQVVQFLRQVASEPITPAASQRALQLLIRFCLSHGLLIGDAQIAATALELGLTLYTRNVRHFQMIPGLNVVRPY